MPVRALRPYDRVLSLPNINAMVQKLSMPVRALRHNAGGEVGVHAYWSPKTINARKGVKTHRLTPHYRPSVAHVQKLSMPVRALRQTGRIVMRMSLYLEVQKLSMPVRALRLVVVGAIL